MNAVAALESLGLTLSFTPDGKLALEGLKRLSTEQRDNAVSLAKAHKPAIMEELLRRAGVNPWEAHWRACCPDYWEGCWHCPDGDVTKRVFCRRHPRPAWAEVLQ